MLQDSKKFENMSDQEVYEVIDGDFFDLFFELEEAVGLFKDKNLELSKGTMTFLVESIGASVRESATKIHQSLEELYNLLPCETEEDIKNVFRQHTILFSYMQNLI